MSTFEIIGLCMIASVLFIAYHMWKAPLMEEQSDGSYKTIKPEKKLSELFKKKNKL